MATAHAQKYSEALALRGEVAWSKQSFSAGSSPRLKPCRPGMPTSVLLAPARPTPFYPRSCCSATHAKPASTSHALQ